MFKTKGGQRRFEQCRIGKEVHPSFMKANFPNCGLRFRRSARYLKILEEFREILQYWWETSSYSTAPDARKLSTIFIMNHLSNNMINK